jgi:hypothetical protein
MSENLTALSGKIVVTPRTGPLAAFIEKTIALDIGRVSIA